MTIANQVADFLDRKRRKSPPTYDQYRFILERVMLPWCTTHRITDADKLTLNMQRFIDDLEKKRSPKDKPLAVATIRTYERSVRIFLKWAGSPAGGYDVPPEPERMRDTLSREEIAAMERASNDERDRLIVRVLADCGLRVSELLGLRLADLREDSHRRRYFIRVIGKGDRQREVGIPPDVYKRLRHFAQLDPSREFIFYAKRGEARLTRHGVDQLIRNLARKAEIERRVWPHLMRHSFITQQIRSGKMNLVELQRAVGHRSLAMISRVYSHTSADDVYDKQIAGLKG